MLGEEPGECGSADECKGHQNWIGPMQRAKGGSRRDGGAKSIVDGGEKTIHDQRLQRHLLKRAEGEITDEAARIEDMRGKMLEGLQRKSHDAKRYGENGKNLRGAARGEPQIVGAPA